MVYKVRPSGSGRERDRKNIMALGLSIEIRCRRGKWYVYTGRQKILHKFASRHNSDHGRGWNIDYFDRGKYDPSQWKDCIYDKFATFGLKIDVGIGRWRWNQHKLSGGLWPWFPRLPYFYISVYRLGGILRFGLEPYVVDKFSQGMPQPGRGDPKYRAIYPRFVQWGKAKEAGNIYVRPVYERC